MSRYLPEEIIGDILPRLPAKSVLRFRCVCKSWLKLFRNPNFVKHHLKYAKQRNSTNLLLS
ncbi:hypothetical protein MKW94_000196, partial [Papaver nudicaule]|nr:hypothetical protein [Papaver nudicaule]